MLEHGADPYAGMQDGPAMGPLHTSACAGHLENIDELIRMLPATKQSNTDANWEMYPWRAAVICGQTKAFQHYLAKYPSLVDKD